MANIAEFVWAGLLGGGLTASLLAIAATAGKAQLSHWLNKDLERLKKKHAQELADTQAKYQRELEEDKARYQRELEAYRTMLIAATESIKANQEVRKAMALQMANKRFKAIERLMNAVEGRGLELIRLFSSSHEMAEWQCVQRVMEWKDPMTELKFAIQSASHFIGSERAQVVLRLHITIAEALNVIAQRKGGEADAQSFSHWESRIISAQHQAEEVLRKEMAAMMAMTDAA